MEGTNSNENLKQVQTNSAVQIIQMFQKIQTHSTVRIIQIVLFKWFKYFNKSVQEWQLKVGLDK